MIVPTLADVGLSKSYGKWPSAMMLVQKYFRSTPSLRHLESRVGAMHRGVYTRMLGRSAGDVYHSSRIANKATHCDSASHITPFSKGMHREMEERQITLGHSRGFLPRFHVDELPATKGLVIRVNGDEFWHMTRVLRLNVNDRVELFDGRGGIVEATLLRVRNSCVEVSAVTERQIIPQTGPEWHVAAAFGTLKGVVQIGLWKSARCVAAKVFTFELGAQTLTPLLTKRSPVVPGQRTERWHRISMAATKQCQRLHTLKVREPTRLELLLPDVQKAEVVFLAAAGAPPLVQAVLKRSKRMEGGLLLIGPEGDFTPEEIELLTEAGAIPVGLGQRRLRVETAAVAILTAVMLLSDGYPMDS